MKRRSGAVMVFSLIGWALASCTSLTPEEEARQNLERQREREERRYEPRIYNDRDLLPGPGRE